MGISLFHLVVLEPPSSPPPAGCPVATVIRPLGTRRVSSKVARSPDGLPAFLGYQFSRAASVRVKFPPPLSDTAPSPPYSNLSVYSFPIFSAFGSTTNR